MIYFGIDLGTTNSVISFSQESNSRIIANPIDIDRFENIGSGIDAKYVTKRAKTLPSCVYYNDGKTVVGDFAREQYKKYPEKVIKSIKSEMGNPVVSNISDEITDKTPEDVSARILAHLKHFAEMNTRQKISNVIITVPANFDTAKKEATMRAAEKAGFSVRNPDNTWKSILISEPNAVLYDLAQKLLNGEVAQTVLDLSKKQRVIVFDIGGGTLDVTFHELERDTENGMVLNISEIAASRFTQLAGDDFDSAIADVLYDRCINKFKTNEPSAVQRIQSRKPMVKKMLTVAAEQLKININAMTERNMFAAADSWFGGFEEDDNGEISYDISHSIGDERMYNDTVTKDEFESILLPFLGKKYTFNDYKGYSSNSRIDRKTIIAPILDVLEKAARHYGKRNEELGVDAVILNGGMSKLYLIKDRIQEFFGIEPITTADPDLSVANGAAIYAAISEIYNVPNRITIKRHVQNDDLYLGLAAGVNDPLISAGDELPCTKTITGYRVLHGNGAIEIPIKQGVENGEPQIIARGIINFTKLRSSANLKIEANFDQTGLLSIKAILMDNDNNEIESKTVEISLGAPLSRNQGGGRIIPADGAKLIPANEINALKNLFSVKNRSNNRREQIDSKMDTILNCGNPADFEETVIKHLSESNSTHFRHRLYEIVAALAHSWSATGISNLKTIAVRDILSDDLDFLANPARKDLSTFVEAVLAQI